MLRIALTLWLLTGAALAEHPLHEQYIKAHRDAQRVCGCLRACAVQIDANQILRGSDIPHYGHSAANGQCECELDCVLALQKLQRIRKKANEDKNKGIGWTIEGEVLKRSSSPEHEICFAAISERRFLNSAGARACATVLARDEPDQTGIFRRLNALATNRKAQTPDPSLSEPEIRDDAQDERANLAAETGNQLSHLAVLEHEELNSHAHAAVQEQIKLNKAAVDGVAELNSIETEIRERVQEIGKILERESYLNQQALLNIKMAIDGATRVASAVKQDPSLTVPQALRESDDLFKKYPGVAQIRFVIAMVPDPRVPRHKRGYSLAISGISRGLAAEQFFLDQYHFPWTRYIQTEDNGVTDTVAEAAKPEKYGLMVFRKDADRTEDCRMGLQILCTELIAVYVVPEAVTYAFHRSSMQGAVERVLWHKAEDSSGSRRKESKTVGDDDLLIIGPSFSSSVEPLRRTFGSAFDESPMFRDVFLGIENNVLQKRLTKAMRELRLAIDRAHAACLESSGAANAEMPNTCGAIRVGHLTLDAIEQSFKLWLDLNGTKSGSGRWDELAPIIYDLNVVRSSILKLGDRVFSDSVMTQERFCRLELKHSWLASVCPVFRRYPCQSGDPPKPAKVRLISPTATVSSNVKYNSEEWFSLDAIRESDDQRQEYILRALQETGVTTRQVAIIGEDSVFGRSRMNGENNSLTLPPGIADIRASAAPRGNLDRDVLPEFERRRVAKLQDGVENGSEYPLSERSLMATVGDSIMIQRALFEVTRDVKAAILRFTDVRDRLFMIEQLRAIAPNLLIIVPEYDDVLLHPDFRHVTRGVWMLRDCAPGKAGDNRPAFNLERLPDQRFFQSDDEFYFALAAQLVSSKAKVKVSSCHALFEIPNGLFVELKSLGQGDYGWSFSILPRSWTCLMCQVVFGLLATILLLVFAASLWPRIFNGFRQLRLRRAYWPRSQHVVPPLVILGGLAVGLVLLRYILAAVYSGPFVIPGYEIVAAGQVAVALLSVTLLVLALWYRGGVRDLCSDFRRWGAVSGLYDEGDRVRRWAHLPKVRLPGELGSPISLASRPGSMLPLLDLFWSLIRSDWPKPAPDLYTDSEYTRSRWALRFSALIIFVRGSALLAFFTVAAGLLLGIWFPLAYANVYGITMLLLGFASLVVYVSAGQYVEGFDELWALLCDRKPVPRTWVDLVRGSLLPLVAFMLLVAAVSTPGLAALSQPLFPFVQMILGVN